MPVPPRASQHHRNSDFDVTYRYNNASFRGADFAPSRLYDLTLLGDSFFFGVGVNEEETLFNRLSENGYTVFNASENASNPIEYFVRWRRLQSLGLKTKRIILGLFVGNDFQNIASVDNLREVLAADYPFDHHLLGSVLSLERIQYLVWAGYTRFLTPHHYLVHTFERTRPFQEDWIAWYANGNRTAMAQMSHTMYTPVKGDAEYLALAQLSDVSIRNTGLILHALKRSFEARQELSILIIPDRHFALGELSKQYKETITRFRDSLDPTITVIDLHDDVTADLYFANDGHWNSKGHALVAQVLLQHLNRGRVRTSTSSR